MTLNDDQIAREVERFAESWAGFDDIDYPEPEDNDTPDLDAMRPVLRRYGVAEEDLAECGAYVMVALMQLPLGVKWWVAKLIVEGLRNSGDSETAGE